MKNYFVFFVAFQFFSFIAFAQIEKPKTANGTNAKPKTNTTTPTQAIIEVTWKGDGTAIIHVGEKTISLASNEKGNLSVTPGLALAIKVEKPDQTYSYSDFVKFNAGKNFLDVGITNGIVNVKSESEIQKQDRIEGRVKIGTQIWTSRNLEVATFRNGDPIPEAQSDEEWKKAGEEGKPAWCYYKQNAANGEIYGKLYNWYAINDPRGLAPKGYHIPSDAEWTTLIDFLGASSAGKKMKATSGWYQDGNGTNESKFSSLPGGYRDTKGFYQIGNNGYWWSSTESKTYATSSLCRFMYFYADKVDRDVYFKENGLSVRCIKD